MVVKLGATKLGEWTKYCKQMGTYDRHKCSSEPQDINVGQILRHPECRKEGDWKNDIALLKLSKEPMITGEINKKNIFIFVNTYMLNF